jgi:gamma-glutamyl-gamma-aminobutyrate hydrolase PuuD
MGKRRQRRIRQKELAMAMTGRDVIPFVEKDHKITFMKDSSLAYPEMWLEVYVEGTKSEEQQFAEMFVRSRCRRASDPTTADLVVFSGGADVDPLLYGEKRHSSVHIDLKRDLSDLTLYQLCLDEGIPMLGICRGAQFLHVMNGGSLFQDVDHHYGDHDMWDIRNKVMVNNVSSVHHQMVLPSFDNGFEMIAFKANLSKKRVISPSMTEEGGNKDVEAFFYRDTGCIGIQGHPEYRGYNEFTKWSLDLINQLLCENPDFEYRGKKCRMKKDLMDLRQVGRRLEIGDA